jgi:hypothetical protein
MVREIGMVVVSWSDLCQRNKGLSSYPDRIEYILLRFMDVAVNKCLCQVGCLS